MIIVVFFDIFYFIFYPGIFIINASVLWWISDWLSADGESNF